MTFTPDVVYETVLIVATALPRTFALDLVILLATLPVATGFALVEMKKIPVINHALQVLLSYQRGVPLLVHLFIAMITVPTVVASLARLIGAPLERQDISPEAVVVIAFTAFQACIQSQNIRGAFHSVPPGQTDAGRSMGFTRLQVVLRITLPQAMTVLIPTIVTAYLRIFKGLSLAFTVGVVDVLAQARLTAALNYHYLESYVAAALIYWLVCLLLQALAGHLELRTRYVH